MTGCTTKDNNNNNRWHNSILHDNRLHFDRMYHFLPTLMEPEPVGAEVFGWSRFFHPAPAPNLRYYTYISIEKISTA